jgi:hypothetical protein
MPGMGDWEPWSAACQIKYRNSSSRIVASEDPAELRMLSAQLQRLSVRSLLLPLANETCE